MLPLRKAMPYQTNTGGPPLKTKSIRWKIEDQFQVLADMQLQVRRRTCPPEAALTGNGFLPNVIFTKGGYDMKKIVGVIIGLIALLIAGIYFLFPETLFRLAEKAERRIAGLVKKETRVDDHTIVYLEGGKGQTIVLLHGFGANKDNWIRFARNLTGDYHVVIPDMPGFGESSRMPNERYDAEAQLKRIDRFTEAMNLERFHMAGNSMGGMLSAMYGATYPRKVLTLALLAPSGVRSPKLSEMDILLRNGTNPLLTGSAEDYDRLLELCFVKVPFIPYQFKKILVANAITYLPGIQAPVLILWGDADKILDVGGVSVLENNLKNYRTVIMKDTGHIPMLEKPRETASHYVSFLKGKN
jgi:abhydrolase domain-containing protein 6